jgi:hypothetical protein
VADAQKNEIKPWLKQQWVIPTRSSAAFVANMEGVLDIYANPYDSSRPVVCVDECGKQLIGDVREPLPVRPGRVARQDSEYRRGGMANMFMAFEPLAGRRHVEVTARKTSIDFACFLRTVSDDLYPDTEIIVLVCDNLSPHISRVVVRFSVEVGEGGSVASGSVFGWFGAQCPLSPTTISGCTTVRLA